MGMLTCPDANNRPCWRIHSVALEWIIAPLSYYYLNWKGKIWNTMANRQRRPGFTCIWNILKYPLCFISPESITNHRISKLVQMLRGRTPCGEADWYAHTGRWKMNYWLVLWAGWVQRTIKHPRLTQQHSNMDTVGRSRSSSASVLKSWSRVGSGNDLSPSLVYGCWAVASLSPPLFIDSFLLMKVVLHRIEIILTLTAALRAHATVFPLRENNHYTRMKHKSACWERERWAVVKRHSQWKRGADKRWCSIPGSVKPLQMGGNDFIY